VQQPPQQPPQQPWGNRPQRPWGTQPEPRPPPQPPWGQPSQPPQRPWGYRPPPKEPPGPGAKPPWYRHPVGMLLIGAVVVILLALIAPAFTGGDEDPQPAPTTGAAGGPAPAPGPPVTATSSTLPMTPADRLGQAVQDELGGVGTVTQVTAPPGGVLTVTWEVTPAGSAGLTRNNARFGVMRIMRAVQQAGVGTDQGVRLVGRFQLPGGATPTTVLRLRFARPTVERTDFDDRRYLEAFELADAAVVHPAFRG
jgi:hypothetical protein